MRRFYSAPFQTTDIIFSLDRWDPRRDREQRTMYASNKHNFGKLEPRIYLRSQGAVAKIVVQSLDHIARHMVLHCINMFSLRSYKSPTT